MTNPFLNQQPAAQPATAPQQPAAAPNPFPASVPQQQPAAPGNPYAQQQAPAAAAPPAYAAPVQQQPQQAAAPSYGTPPALNPAGLSNVGAPPPTGGKGAKLADMYGRLVLCFPLSISRVPKSAQYITDEQRQRGDLDQDRMVVTVVVLDDGQGGMQPIAYGGAPHALPPTPHTTTEPLPYVRKAMWITQTKLIEQLRPFLPQAPGAAPGMVAGRVVKGGPAHNDPWFLQAADDAGLGLAGYYLEAVQSGTYPHPLA